MRPTARRLLENKKNSCPAAFSRLWHKLQETGGSNYQASGRPQHTPHLILGMQLRIIFIWSINLSNIFTWISCLTVKCQKAVEWREPGQYIGWTFLDNISVIYQCCIISQNVMQKTLLEVIYRFYMYYCKSHFAGDAMSIKAYQLNSFTFLMCFCVSVVFKLSIMIAALDEY